jgi:hypothetical protein
VAAIPARAERGSGRVYEISAARVGGWVAFVAAGVGAAALANALGIPMAKLTLDAATIPGHSHFRGAISNFGLMIWSSAGTAVLLGAVCAHLRPEASRSWRRFLAATGIGVLYLGIDDAWLFHEDVAIDYFGIDEKIVYLLYALVLVTWTVRFLRQIQRTDIVVLAVAVASLSTSVVMDALTELNEEEYFKYAGLVCLLVWCVRTAVDEVAALRRQPAD